MIIGIGTDIIKLSRIQASFERLGNKFAQRILSLQEFGEFTQSKAPIALLAKRFAVKEAAGKALGTGIGQGVSWQDIYVEHDQYGAPILCFTGQAALCAEQKGITHLQVSISDEEDLAIAFVVLSSEKS